MTQYDVLMSDRSRVLVDVRDGLPEHRAARVAMGQAGAGAFAARPQGCTGLAYNVHFGAENACPVHRDPLDACSHSDSTHLRADTGRPCRECHAL